MTEPEALTHGCSMRPRKPHGHDTGTQACHTQALPLPPSATTPHSSTLKVFVYVKIPANVALVKMAEQGNTELASYHSHIQLTAKLWNPRPGNH